MSLLAASGALAGGLGAAFVISHHTATLPEVSVNASVDRASPDPTVARHRMVALAAESPRPSASPKLVSTALPAATADDPSVRGPKGVVREEQRTKDAEDFHARLVMHEQEPRDRAWAATMEETVAQDMVRETSRDFKARPGHVDCRSVSCTVDVTWDKPEDAYGEYDMLVTLASQSVPCIRTIMLEDAVDDGPYSAKLYLDYTGARYGEESAANPKDGK